ncbi:UNVERIFIED_CONTAM: hypothetical protein Sradi_7244300 [Sesamum radiatum]|uniref:Reverse transcriptase zinc-binding domain-containing protein n=1 Tax=Sesamum radiatum TaxID=300843 RepID=A0AAW2IMF6_SESRA
MAHRDWEHGIQWAASRWRGKHVVNAAFRSLLASLVYHIWQERNSRHFQQRSRPPSIVGMLVVEEIRQRIISVPLRHSICSLGLFRLWKIPWPVEGPIDEGGLGIKDILALNRALMSKHLWAVIKQDRTSIWVDWIIQVRLRDCSIWTAKENKGAWGWRKMLSLRNSLMSHIHYRVGSGESVSLWHDPWHPLGPLISRFPRGPQMTRIGPLDKLSAVIKDGQWNWPFITDIACLEITHMLPPFWRARTESFGSQRMDPQHLNCL